MVPTANDEDNRHDDMHREEYLIPEPPEEVNRLKTKNETRSRSLVSVKVLSGTDHCPPSKVSILIIYRQICSSAFLNRVDRVGNAVDKRINQTHASDPLVPNAESRITPTRQTDENVVPACKCDEKGDLGKGENSRPVSDVTG